MEQPYAPQPQFVMMPMAQRNGLGVFGFFVALIGLLVPTGIVSLLGLILSLAAIGRSPRGFATGGVILGMLGTIFWLILMGLAVVAGLVGVVAAGVVAVAAFAFMQPEVVELTTDMVNVAIAAQIYDEEHEDAPEGLEDLDLSAAMRLDPWGQRYHFTITDRDPGFDILSIGPDGVEGTEDDVRFTALEELWEEALEGFEHRMEAFGERMERLQHLQHGRRGGSYAYGWSCQDDYAGDYEHAARAAVEAAERAREEAGNAAELEAERAAELAAELEAVIEAMESHDGEEGDSGVR